MFNLHARNLGIERFVLLRIVVGLFLFIRKVPTTKYGIIEVRVATDCTILITRVWFI